MPYGWIIKHERTGLYGVVNVEPDGIAVSVTPNPNSATMFASRAQAVEVLLHCHRESSTFPDCDVVDYSTPEPPAPDADQAPVPTRAQIIAQAHADGEARRTAHAAARALHQSQPSARLIEKPSTGKH